MSSNSKCKATRRSCSNGVSDHFDALGERHDHVQRIEQIAQRRANLDAITALGIPRIRTRFDDRHGHALVDARRAGTTEDAGGAGVPDARGRPRFISIRSFGKASFLVLSDGRRASRSTCAQDSLTERDFQIFKLLDFGDHVGVEGHLFRTKTNELSIWAVAPAVSGEVSAAAAREVARPDRRRNRATASAIST